MCRVNLWVLRGTARVSVWPFDVGVSRTGSLTSNVGLRCEVYSRYCVGRRPIQFETEICYLDFKDWETGQKYHDSLSGSRYECWIAEYVGEYNVYFQRVYLLNITPSS
jgi:hypothetical protein